jgi:hypothetical protein
MGDDFARLAYEASLRRLDKREASLTEIRSRTGLLLAASSLAASFLGRPAFDTGPIIVPLFALVAFTITIAASVYVLLPKSDFVFALVGSTVFEALYEFRDDLAEVHRRLAYDLDRFWEANDARLQRLLWGFRLAAWALAAEVVLLLASLSGTLG